MPKLNLPQPKIAFVDDRDVVLLADLHIKFDGLIFTVKKGYKTDGVSIPRIFWVLGSPFEGKTLPCAIIHDIFFESELYSRGIANRCFLFLMRKNGVSWLKRTLYFVAVSTCGWYTYFKHTVGSVENARQYLQISKSVL